MQVYPEFAEVNGKVYSFNTDYRYGLKCFEIIKDKGISDTERTLAILSVIYKEEIDEKDIDTAYKKACVFLQCGKKQDTDDSSIVDIDIVYDEDFIVSSYMSDYKIDLPNIEYLHFYQFCQLITGLTESSIMSKVRDIRNYDLSELKDSKQRAKMIKAKEKLALPIELSKEEKEVIDEFEALFE